MQVQAKHIDAYTYCLVHCLQWVQVASLLKMEWQFCKGVLHQPFEDQFIRVLSHMNSVPTYVSIRIGTDWYSGHTTKPVHIKIVSTSDSTTSFSYSIDIKVCKSEEHNKSQIHVWFTALDMMTKQDSIFILP